MSKTTLFIGHPPREPPPRSGAVAVVFLLLGAACAGAGSPVLDEARRILANTRDTLYQHKTSVDEAAGRYHLDCSGLATVILRRAGPRALRVVEEADRPGHPRARAYHDVFAAAPTNAAAASNGWLRVVRAADLQPGDFIAWRKRVLIPGESTGHVMIVDRAPVGEDDGSWRVAVIDSTTRPHAGDTRAAGTAGVGRGDIWLTVDRNGRPSGFRTRARRETPQTRLPIALGRLVPESPAPPPPVTSPGAS